jgi:uncharacterized protein (DUF1330 family)
MSGNASRAVDEIIFLGKCQNPIPGSLLPWAGIFFRSGAELVAARTNSHGRNVVKEQIMSRIAFTGIGMLAGIAIGAAAVTAINAQGRGPGAYAIVDISEVSDPATFKTLLPIAGKANDQFGGKFIARTENIVAQDGTAPKRFVVIAFESMDKAKAWDKSPLQEEVNTIRRKSTKSRTFLVDGELQ